MNPQIKLVLFDFDGVLSKGRFFSTVSEIRAVADKILFTKEAWPFMKEWMEGKKSYIDVVNLLVANSEFSFLEIKNCLIESVEAFKLNQELLSWNNSIRKSGIKTAVFTDNMDVFDLYTTSKLELNSLFDNVYSSSKYRKLKLDDDAEFLKFVISDMNMKPEESLFIDDSPKIKEPMDKIGGYSYIYTDYENEFPKFLETMSKL